MNPIVSRLKALILSAVAVLSALNGLAVRPGAALAAESAKPNPCVAREYRQFDFWIGDWDVFDVDDPTARVARVRVDRILDGCVLCEDYEDAKGHKGQSFSIYDASRKVWHQSWVTNRGQLLLIEGNFQSGENDFEESGSDR